MHVSVFSKLSARLIGNPEEVPLKTLDASVAALLDEVLSPSLIEVLTLKIFGMRVLMVEQLLRGVVPIAHQGSAQRERDDRLRGACGAHRLRVCPGQRTGE